MDDLLSVAFVVFCGVGLLAVLWGQYGEIESPLRWRLLPFFVVPLICLIALHKYVDEPIVRLASLVAVQFVATWLSCRTVVRYRNRHGCRSGDKLSN